MSDIQEIYCSFCGKRHDEVDSIIAGPNNIFICNECVGSSVEILIENGDKLFTAEGSRILIESNQPSNCNGCGAGIVPGNNFCEHCGRVI